MQGSGVHAVLLVTPAVCNSYPSCMTLACKAKYPATTYLRSLASKSNTPSSSTDRTSTRARVNGVTAALRWRRLEQRCSGGMEPLGALNDKQLLGLTSLHNILLLLQTRSLKSLSLWMACSTSCPYKRPEFQVVCSSCAVWNHRVVWCHVLACSFGVGVLASRKILSVSRAVFPSCLQKFAKFTPMPQ